jgi:hypothetical protein
MSALEPIAHAGLTKKSPTRFFTALLQALHDAYALGWKDRGNIERAK